MRAPLRFLLLLAIGLGFAGPATAHEGEDHGAPPMQISAAAPRAEATSDDHELVAVARGGELEITLDRFRDNEPVEDAVLEIDTPSGVLKPAHRGNGVYVAAAPFLRAAGKHDLVVTVTTGDQVDLLTATLEIPHAADGPSQHAALVTPGTNRYALAGFAGAVFAAFIAGLSAARGTRGRAVAAGIGLAIVALLAAQSVKAQPVARDVAQRLPDGAVFAPKATQRILAIRTQFTAEEAHARSVELPGRIIPDPNASGLVQASVGGRLSPPSGGFKPLGAAVKVGDILAYVRQPLPSADATVQAQQARELDQQIALLQRKVERLSAIQQVIARSQLEDAQLELKGLRERRSNLDRVNRVPEPLTAPVNGVIAAANAVAGQMAEPTSIIFQIVDPAKLWVEALAFEPESLTKDASARGGDGRRMDLSYVGSGLADRNQAIPVQFAISGDAGGLRSGQFVSVFARTTEARKGIALPRSAVLRSASGQTIVYEHANAERFVPREVRAVGLDGERLLVVSGLEPGRRIVTQGAELLDQVR